MSGLAALATRSLARALALAVLLVGSSYTVQAVTRVNVVLPTLGIVDAPMSMRVAAICRSDQMAQSSRVRRPTALAIDEESVYVADAERRTLERWLVGECRPVQSVASAGEVRGLAWLASGELIALDATGERAAMYTRELRPAGQIDLRGGDVKQPRGLVVDGERIAVLGGDGTIASFGLDGRLRARFPAVPGGPGQFGVTAIAPHRESLLVADPGNNRVHLVSWDGAATSSWAAAAPTTELSAGARGIAIGTSPRAGAVVALSPEARGFVVVSGPDGTPLRVGGDVLAADEAGRVAGASPDGIILLELVSPA